MNLIPHNRDFISQSDSSKKLDPSVLDGRSAEQLHEFMLKLGYIRIPEDVTHDHPYHEVRLMLYGENEELVPSKLVLGPGEYYDIVEMSDGTVASLAIKNSRGVTFTEGFRKYHESLHRRERKNQQAVKAIEIKPRISGFRSMLEALFRK
jgi:hypothetical protein